MSEHRQPGRGKKLPLPSPRSPLQLDEKILAHARTHAPRKPSGLQHPWIAGLATTGVIVLALFITVPWQPAPPLPGVADQATDTDAMYPMAKRATAEKPAPAAKQADLPDMETSGMEMSRMQMYEMETREQRSMADEAFTQPAPPVLGAAAAPAIKELNLDNTRLPEPVFSQAELQLEQQLQRLGILLQDGDEARARADYQALRASCADCALPETLEQALAAHPRLETP